MCACEPVSGRPALCWPVGHRSISAPPKATAHLGPVGARSLALSLSRAGSICRGFQVAHVRPRCHLCAGRACKSMVTLMNGLSRWGGRAGRPTSKRERERERERGVRARPSVRVAPVRLPARATPTCLVALSHPRRPRVLITLAASLCWANYKRASEQRGMEAARQEEGRRRGGGRGEGEVARPAGLEGARAQRARRPNLGLTSGARHSQVRWRPHSRLLCIISARARPSQWCLVAWPARWQGGRAERGDGKLRGEFQAEAEG